MVEIGWCWHYGDNHPHFFGVTVDGEVYAEVHFGDAPAGSSHYYSIINNNTKYWEWYVDGHTEMQNIYMPFKQGKAQTSSEKHDLGEFNGSHFWGLLKKNSIGTWYDFTNLQEYYDDDYLYYFSKISETEHIVIK